MATSDNEKWLVAGADQNAGTWPNTGIYDFESGKPNGGYYANNGSPFAQIYNNDPLGSSAGAFANVWIFDSYVNCTTGLPVE